MPTVAQLTWAMPLMYRLDGERRMKYAKTIVIILVIVLTLLFELPYDISLLQQHYQDFGGVTYGQENE